MTHDEIATEYAQAMLQREIEYCTKNHPERMARFTPEERAKLEEGFLAKTKADALAIIARFSVQDELLKMHRIASLHPSNKNTRKLFERWSGKVLPKSPTETEKWLREYIGPEIVDKFYADREAAAKAEADAKAAAENEKNLARLTKLATDVSSDLPIDGCGLVDLAKWLEVPLHPRTIGTIRDRVKQIQEGKGVLYGRNPWPNTVWQTYRAVKEAVHLKGF